MEERIKWGVFGNALIASKCVIPAIRKSRNGEVHALATRSPAAAQELATRNDIKKIYESFDRVLSDPDVDAVYIPLPNHLHHGWTMNALAAGKHVLCEKPIACNAQEAREMAERATESGMLLMEALMYRFHPRSVQIKKVVDNGGIGKPRLVRSAFCYRMDDEMYNTNGNTRLKAGTGGGALLDVGCYSVSVARWFMAAEPVRVQAQAFYNANGVDVHLVGTLVFPENRLAVVEASFISALQQTYTIVGSNGAIELPHNAFIPWENDAVYIAREKDDEKGKIFTVKGADEYQLMVEHFGDAVLKKAGLMHTPDDSIANMCVLDALSQAARTGNTVMVKPARL